MSYENQMDQIANEPSPHIPDTWRTVLRSGNYHIDIPTTKLGVLHTRFDNSHFLGEGATSKVLLIDTDTDNKEYIAKIIDDLKYVRSGGLSQEIAIHQQVDHPNIAKLIDHSQAEPQKFKNEKYYYPCLVKEYLPTSLEERINQKNLTESEILEIFKGMCSALQHIYDKTGEVIIDLEPAQIRFSKDGTCKLNDLGYTANNTIGSVHNWSDHYTDPEISRDGRKNAEPKHTVYNLSLLLWQCYTGKNFVMTGGINNDDKKIPEKIYQLIETGIKKTKDTEEILSPAEFYSKLRQAHSITTYMNDVFDK